jgi:hypothetical protein
MAASADGVTATNSAVIDILFLAFAAAGTPALTKPESQGRVEVLQVNPTTGEDRPKKARLGRESPSYRKTCPRAKRHTAPPPRSSKTTPVAFAIFFQCHVKVIPSALPIRIDVVDRIVPGVAERLAGLAQVWVDAVVGS